MIGLVAKFTEDNTLNFTQVNRGIELFYVEDIPRNGLGIDGGLRPSCLRAPIAEAFHTFEDKAPSFVTHHGPLHPGLTTAFSRRFGKEDNWPNDLIIMLDGIDKVLPNLREFLLSRHPIAPCGTPRVPIRLPSLVVYRSSTPYSQLHSRFEATFSG